MVIIVPVCVVGFAAAAGGTGYGGYKYNRRKKGKKTISRNESQSSQEKRDKQEHASAVISPGGDKFSMQDSRAYGILPFGKEPGSSEGIE
eukprot:m.56645 g.56645  ORF g.56645 m.56645 type:complete len:90 (+) comp34622_c0_seq1:210-479(+)